MVAWEESRGKDYKGIIRELLEMLDLFIILVSQIYTSVKTYEIRHSNYTWFIICRLYLSKAFKITKEKLFLKKRQRKRVK